MTHLNEAEKKPFDGNFAEALIGSDLKKRYSGECSECGEDFEAAPSLFMQIGQNSGMITCPNCKIFLEVEIDEKNEKMNSREFLAPKLGQKPAALSS